MSRLFYPILFTVTAALAATLWARHGLPTHWLATLDAAVAQAQSPPNAAPPTQFRSRPGLGPGNQTAAAPNESSAPPPRAGTSQPPTNGPATRQGLLPTSQATQPPAAAPQPVGASRSRQAPYTQARLDSLRGGRDLEITKPIPVPSAKVVARVGTEIILAADVLPQVNEEFQQIARRLPPEQQAQYFEMLMANHVKQLVQVKLVAGDAKRGVAEDKVAEMKKSILSHFDQMALPPLLERYKCKPAEIDAKLKEHGSSLAKEKERFFDQALISEWMRKEMKYDEHVGPEELLKYYHEHLAEYEFKAKVRFEEIRISYGKKRNKHEAWLAIRGLAERVYAGASMTELAKAHSESLTAEKGGLHDWTNQGSLACKPLDDALFALPVGALSNIIDDDKGHAFVVVRVVERAAAGVTSFREAQAGIRQKIKEQRREAAKAKRLTDFMQENKFRAWTIYDDMLREMQEKAENAAKKQAKPGTRLLTQ